MRGFLELGCSFCGLLVPPHSAPRTLLCPSPWGASMPNAETTLVLRFDSAQADQALGTLRHRLLEEFPEASLELVSDLLLCALDSGAIRTGSSASLAGDGVGGLEICLDTARVVEFLASTLRAGQGNRVAHGQPLSELIDVEERQSYPAGAGRLISCRHVPGDTRTPPAPGAVRIGPEDV